MNDQPNFAAWSTENLAKFAADTYVRIKEQHERIEQLQQELKSLEAKKVGTIEHEQNLRDLAAMFIMAALLVKGKYHTPHEMVFYLAELFMREREKHVKS